MIDDKEQLKLEFMLRYGMEEIEANKRIEDTYRHDGREGLERLKKALAKERMESEIRN